MSILNLIIDILVSTKYRSLYFSTVIGITAKDGVILAVEKLIDSDLFEAEANRRIFHIDSHIGMVNVFIVLLAACSIFST